jgi:hypothetical protein
MKTTQKTEKKVKKVLTNQQLFQIRGGDATQRDLARK